MSEHHTINGEDLYYAVLSGAEELRRNMDHINQINVFPVADGDTGTNMYATFQGALAASSIMPTIGGMADALARGAVLSSRGNSGAILAQWFATLAEKLKGRETADSHDFVVAVEAGAAAAHACLQEPAPGTILDVLTNWARWLREKVESNRSLNLGALLQASLEVAKAAVQKTREMMPLLQRSGVVDAGAEGFYYFLQGMAHYLVTKIRPATENVPAIEEEFHPHNLRELDEIKFRFCTEGVLNLRNHESAAAVEKIIRSSGDSFARAGAGGYLKFHIHTNAPERLFTEIHPHAEILNPKAEDMRLQARIHLQAHKKTAIVIDSAVDLPQDIIERENIFQIPINLMIDGSTFLDKLTINTERFYAMLDTTPKYPLTSQPSPAAFENLYRFLLTYYESIVSIHISSALSGTLQSAQSAAQRVAPGRIFTVDTKSISSGSGLLVTEFLRKRNPDWTPEEIVAYFEERRNKAKILVAVRTMKYMVRSGRVSPLRGLIAKILNLKPVITLDENGKSVLFGKTYSQKATIHLIKKEIARLDQEKKIICFAIGHAAAARQSEQLAEEIKKILPGRNCEYIMDIAPVIGLHAGKGAVSVALLTEA